MRSVLVKPRAAGLDVAMRALVLVFLLALAACAGRPDLPPQAPGSQPVGFWPGSGASERVVGVKVTADACPGRIDTATCAIDSFVACLVRQDQALCNLVAGNPGDYPMDRGWPPHSPDLVLRYRVVGLTNAPSSGMQTHNFQDWTVRQLDVWADLMIRQCYEPDAALAQCAPAFAQAMTIQLRPGPTGWKAVDWSQPE